MSRILSTAAILALLAGCNGSVKMTDIAKAACTAQESANAAGVVAARYGSTEWAARFAEASRISGLACAW